LIADQHPPAAADDHHRVRVMVPLERGPPARLDLEVAQVAGEPVAALEQGLPVTPAKWVPALL